MDFAYPEHWVWWWCLPIVIGGLIWAARARRRDLSRYAETALLPQMASSLNPAARVARTGLVVGGAILLLFAAVGPQWGFKWEEVKHRGVDLIIALDVSKSMLAEDVKPNRLERAKLAIRDLLPLLKGDRIGLVVFAGTSFVQCPLTVDYEAFAMMLDDVSMDSTPVGGTDIGGAVRASLKAFNAAASPSQALVLVTDGESLEGDPLSAAREAAKAGVRIHCIGIGTSEGELIPVTDEQGQQQFLKDREGRTVKTKLDEDLLRRVAQETGGSLVRASATSFGLDLLYRERISRMEQQEFETSMRKQMEHRFQWPLGFALLLLALEPLISDRTKAARARSSARSRGASVDANAEVRA